MRVSYPLLLLLAEEGDETAALITHAWKEETGILLNPPGLQVHYRPIHDYFVIHTSDGRLIAAPTRWDCVQPPLTLEHPIINDTLWYQKVR